MAIDYECTVITFLIFVWEKHDSHAKSLDFSQVSQLLVHRETISKDNAIMLWNYQYNKSRYITGWVEGGGRGEVE